MQINFHAGVHGAEEDRLFKTLLRNSALLLTHDTLVPGPSRYRALLQDSLAALGNSDQPPAPDARDILIDAILDEESGATHMEPKRMILSNANLLGLQRYGLRDGEIYRSAPERIALLAQLFSGDRIEIWMGLRNPALWIPDLVRSQNGAVSTVARDAVLGNREPTTVRWSDFLKQIRAAAPEVGLTVWATEDTPLLWGHLIREISGLPPLTQIKGAFDILSQVMHPDGMKRFRAYLSENEGLNELQRRRVMSAFLGKYALEDALEDEIDLSGWNDDLIEEITDRYYDDLDHISTIPGVTLIAP